MMNDNLYIGLIGKLVDGLQKWTKGANPTTNAKKEIVGYFGSGAKTLNGFASAANVGGTLSKITSVSHNQAANPNLAVDFAAAFNSYFAELTKDLVRTSKGNVSYWSNRKAGREALVKFVQELKHPNNGWSIADALGDTKYKDVVENLMKWEPKRWSWSYLSPTRVLGMSFVIMLLFAIIQATYNYFYNDTLWNINIANLFLFPISFIFTAFLVTNHLNLRLFGTQLWATLGLVISLILIGISIYFGDSLGLAKLINGTSGRAARITEAASGSGMGIAGLLGMAAVLAAVCGATWYWYNRQTEEVIEEKTL